MPDDGVRWQEEHVDWEPLRAVLPDPEELGSWMWMYVADSTATGEPVHHYKNVWTRRYLRLDRLGRCYAEDSDDELRLVAGGCGTALLVGLALVFDGMENHLPERIRLPEAVRVQVPVPVGDDGRRGSTVVGAVDGLDDDGSPW